jgi:hypothetical protein
MSWVFVLDGMAGPVPLPSPAPRGAYAVRMPRHTDAVAAALRSAYSVEKMPADIRAALARLDGE